MDKIKMAVLVAIAAMLAMCLFGCSSSASSGKVGTASASSGTAASSTSAAGATASKSSSTSTSKSKSTSTSASASNGATGNAHAVTVPEHDWGEWSLVRLDCVSKENGNNVVEGRYEGDGTVMITKTGYNLEFAYPDGQVALESSGMFTTGAQATFIGDSTIDGYPIAMFGGFGSGIVMKFTDEGRTHEIIAIGTQR